MCRHVLCVLPCVCATCTTATCTWVSCTPAYRTQINGMTIRLAGTAATGNNHHGMAGRRSQLGSAASAEELRRRAAKMNSSEELLESMEQFMHLPEETSVFALQAAPLKVLLSTLQAAHSRPAAVSSLLLRAMLQCIDATDSPEEVICEVFKDFLQSDKIDVLEADAQRQLIEALWRKEDKYASRG